MSAKLTDTVEAINVLWYGDGGTGKTTSMAAMANLGPILMFNAEQGVKARPLRERGINVDNIEVFPDPKSGERISFKALESEWLRVREALEQDPSAYAGVCWDSVTEIYQALLTDVVGVAGERARRAGRERDEHFVALEDYGVMTQQVRNLIRKYRDLPCHFGMSALAKREQDDDGRVVYQPQITAKLQIDLIGWVDMVCHTSVMDVAGRDVYTGLFRPAGKYRGKDRLGAMPKRLVDPTFDRIVAYVEGDLDLNSDHVMAAARELEKKAANDPADPGAKSTQDQLKEVAA